MIGNKFRDIRRKKRLTQQECGRLLNVSASTIAMWENEQRDPDTSKLMEISNLFNVSVDWLLSEENKNFQLNVPKTENTVTIIGRNGICETYIVDDEKIKTIKAFAETLAKSDNKKK